MTERKFPKVTSKVIITFTDGEVVEYMITAGAGISRYLADNATESGVLCFWDKDDRSSISIPVSQIRHYRIEEQPQQPEPEMKEHLDALLERFNALGAE
jgi:hypothetical protein